VVEPGCGVDPRIHLCTPPAGSTANETGPYRTATPRTTHPVRAPPSGSRRDDAPTHATRGDRDCLTATQGLLVADRGRVPRALIRAARCGGSPAGAAARA
jgi:hypothetical protein